MVFFVHKVVALLLLVLLIPFFSFLYILTALSTKGGFLFRQKRVGKGGKVFTLLKIRTMNADAESVRAKYRHLNERDGPVFKIKNDPRYTKIGKFLSHIGVDELPQLINIFRGEMVFVGPRPLPVKEDKKIEKIYRRRSSVHPGLTSLWVIKGAHTLTFKEWMELDMWYVDHKSTFLDIKIIYGTFIALLKVIMSKLVDR